MASVFDKRGVWYIKFKNEQGKWVAKASKADTKTAAKVEAQEAERLARRRREGLEPMPADSSLTLCDLCNWWLENRCKPDRVYNERKRLQRHVLDAPVGQTPLAKIRAGHIEDVLVKMERDGLAATTINGLRGLLGTVFSKARKAGVWTGPDVMGDVERRKVPRRIYATLSADEVPRMLGHVPDDWRLYFEAAVLTGMRKGELCGLKRKDVDLDARLLTVARSYDKGTTKGGHADLIPIAEPLMPVLRAALARSTSEWVFPDENGRMRTAEGDPQKVLRHALARAGIVEGYLHTCRRCKATGRKHEEGHPDSAPRKCPNCTMTLWPKAQPRAMRFHDLRHTTATLLLRAGVDPHRVQRILRHSDIKVTVGTYGHLQVEDLRSAMNVLPGSGLAVEEREAEVPRLAVGAEPPAGPFVTRLSPDAAGEKKEGPGAEDFSSSSGPFSWSGRQDLNLRPLGPEPSALPG
ncbi:MAG: hypothetical protein RL199_726 [Pseudomonadota bacterium]